MSTAPTSAGMTPAEFEVLMNDIRPELYRYATRMTGSVIDGEDVVQEALIKAYLSYSELTSDSNLKGWLFRITHNKAIDHLRRSNNEPLELLDEYQVATPPDLPLEDKELATIALSVFLKLVPRQRSTVILKDVLGYSLAEISELLDATVPQIKATLHRGRTRLREMAASVDASTARLDEHETTLLACYIERFNAHDFDAVRDMLAKDVQLEVVGQDKFGGISDVSNVYLHNYGQISDWQLATGIVEGRPAILVYDPNEASSQPAYFMLITWEKDHVSRIRDYRYARYVMHDAEIFAG